jgi:hypothetical protein
MKKPLSAKNKDRITYASIMAVVSVFMAGGMFGMMHITNLPNTYSGCKLTSVETVSRSSKYGTTYFTEVKAQSCEDKDGKEKDMVFTTGNGSRNKEEVVTTLEAGVTYNFETKGVDDLLMEPQIVSETIVFQ